MKKKIIIILLSLTCIIKTPKIHATDFNKIEKSIKNNKEAINSTIEYIYNTKIENIHITTEETQKIQKVIQNTLKTSKNKEDIIKSYYILSWIELLNKNKENQYKYLVTAEKLTNESINHNLVKHIYLSLSDLCLNYFQDKSNAIRYNKKFLSIANKTYTKEEIHPIYRYLKDQYIRNELYDEAQNIVLEWVDYLKKEQDKSKLAEALNSTGLVFATTSLNMNISTEFFLEALDIAEQLDDLNQQVSIMINISLNYINQNNIEESIKYLKMIEEYKLIKKVDSYTRSFVYLNLASNYSNIHDKDNLIKYINLTNENIVDLDEEEKEKFNIILDLLRADVFRIEKKLDESFKQLEACKKRYKDIDNMYFTNFNIDLWKSYGQLYLELSDFKNAIHYFEKALNISKKDNSIINILKIYKELSDIYKETNNFEKALEYSNEYIELYDLIKKQENDEYNSMLLKKFELKDKEVAIKELKLKGELNEKKILILILGICISTMIIYYIIISKKKIEKLNKSLSQLSLIDGLTNIANRRALDDFLESNWNVFIDNKINISIIMIDIDYFKLYNDNYGHQKGDEILSYVAQAINNSCYFESDTIGDYRDCKSEILVARYGGEEFIVVLANKSKEDAIVMAQRIKKSVQNLNLNHKYSKINDKVTLSMGIATETLNQNSDYLTIIEKADNALYYSKQNNRNRYTHIDDVILKRT